MPQDKTEARITFQSPVGLLEIIAADKAIKAIHFSDSKTEAAENPNELALKAQLQLQEYFAGRRTNFDLPLAPEGTAFQQQVWQALQKIPYGKTISYLLLSQWIGNEKAIRAVGSANGQNPIPIIIPCHRVIGSDGKLTGYAGGLWRKEKLLWLEGALQQNKLNFDL